MSEHAVQHVASASPCAGATYWTHLTLAYFANDDAHLRVPQPELARFARLNVGTLRRCVRELIDSGLVSVVEQPAGWTPALLRLEGIQTAPTARADAPTARSRPRTQRGRGASTARPVAQSHPLLIEDQDQDQEIPTADAVGPSPMATARGITQRVWERRDKPPAQPFVAVVKIAQALLDAGWSSTEVEDTMTTVPTISTRWCEAELNRRQCKPEAIDTDREGPPVERIKL